MPKFAFVLVIAALAASVQGFPTFEDDVAAAASSGDWEKVHEILRQSFNFGNQQPFGGLAGDVRSLKQPKGGHVYAEAQTAYKSSSNVNGQINQESGGHKIINKDGEVREWNFKP